MTDGTLICSGTYSCSTRFVVSGDVSPGTSYACVDQWRQAVRTIQSQASRSVALSINVDSMCWYLGDKVVQPIDTGCQIVLLRPLFVGADEEEPVLGDMRGVLIRVEASVHAQLRM